MSANDSSDARAFRMKAARKSSRLGTLGAMGYAWPVSNMLVIGLSVVCLIGTWLRLINLRYARQNAHLVPAGFETAVDAETLRKMAAYSQDTARLALANDAWFKLLIIALVGCGALGTYDQWVTRVSSSYVMQGTLFVLIASWASSVMSLPWDLYENFVVEARHGFNHTTAQLFWLDFIKSKLIVSLVIVVVCVAGLYIVRWAGELWWLLIWAFLLIFQVILTIIAPKVIEPLFVKMTPLEAPQLQADIAALANRVGVRVDRLYQVDASRRSGHTNAYFSGFGPVKRVVVFDTLLARLAPEEIVAILAHELGHWKHRHVWQRMIVGQSIMLVACFGVDLLVRWDGLPALVGAHRASFFLRVTIALLVGSLLEFLISPVLSWWSRHHEWQADAFAAAHVERAHLRSALIKLAKDNLANLHVHPWYAAYHASHPSLPARVARLSQDAPTPIFAPGGASAQ